MGKLKLKRNIGFVVLIIGITSVLLFFGTNDNKNTSEEIKHEKEEILEVKGYALQKKVYNGFQVLFSKQLPNQELEDLNSADIRELAEVDETLVWIPMDESLYNKIHLGDILTIQHNGQLMESSPPILAGVISIKVEDKP